jgi:hypothetical protein
MLQLLAGEMPTLALPAPRLMVRESTREPRSPRARQQRDPAAPSPR